MFGRLKMLFSSVKHRQQKNIENILFLTRSVVYGVKSAPISVTSLFARRYNNQSKRKTLVTYKFNHFYLKFSIFKDMQFFGNQYEYTVTVENYTQCHK